MAIELETKPVDEIIEARFPFSKFMGWTEEIMGRDRKRADLRDKVRQITMPLDRFWRLFPMEIDVPIVQPSTGNHVYVLTGSYFSPGTLASLEDPHLNDVLESQAGNLEQAIPRDLLNDALLYAKVLAGSVVLPHNLTPEEVDEIARDHCLEPLIYHGLSRKPEITSAVLLYGGLRIVANKLRYNQAPQPTESPA